MAQIPDDFLMQKVLTSVLGTSIGVVHGYWKVIYDIQDVQYVECNDVHILNS